MAENDADFWANKHHEEMLVDELRAENKKLSDTLKGIEDARADWQELIEKEANQLRAENERLRAKLDAYKRDELVSKIFSEALADLLIALDAFNPQDHDEVFKHCIDVLIKTHLARASAPAPAPRTSPD
ncbi:MAG: hypothetical protein C5B60_07860 [Chloroflexi bacterium]|nr:MAG: hypothetical protein C5B60_07860 [Chloroflexota bacterium]